MVLQYKIIKRGQYYVTVGINKRKVESKYKKMCQLLA